MNTSVEQQLEKENELDLDLEQADNKFNRWEAFKRAEKISKQFFYEDKQKKYQDEKLNACDLIGAVV